MFIETFFLRMTDTMTSQNIDLSSWDTLYILNPLCEPGYVIPCVGNITEGKFCVNMFEFPTEYENRKYAELESTEFTVMM
jgi:hypothetical protein